MELEASENEHLFIFVDEAGFNLAKTRCRGTNLIGKRATVNIPGLRGANITMCAAISVDGLELQIGPYNTEHLIAFLYELYERL